LEGEGREVSMLRRGGRAFRCSLVKLPVLNFSESSLEGFSEAEKEKDQRAPMLATNN
jgi:hypothetical protein